MAEADKNRQLTGYWIDQINQAEADKHVARWLKRGRIINLRFKDERDVVQAGGGIIPGSNGLNRRKYSVLWSNVMTLGPALYGHVPEAVVSRRYKDNDPVGRYASEVLERALNYTVEAAKLDEALKACRDDYLLPGRGVSWVRYEPVMQDVKTGLTPGDDGQYTDDTGQSYEAKDVQGVDADPSDPHIIEQRVTFERVCIDHVVWDDFLTNTAREYPEVWWGSKRVLMDRDELVKRFGEEIGKQVPLDWKPDNYQESDLENAKKATIYEVCDSRSRDFLWISKGYTAQPLDKRQDPLGLTDFFPFPKPIFSTLGLDSIVPVPDFALYQDQAEELDELTGRIGKLTDALKMVGFYAGENKTQLQNAFAPENENKLIPIESWAQFMGSGGIKGIIEWVPIDLVVQALESCFATRSQIIDDIHQITGISDIMRGDTDPDETATAQKLKGNFGALRVRDRQKEIARFARDNIDLAGQIIASKFSIETLKAMTDVKLLSNAEKAQAQKVMQMAQQAQQSGVQGWVPQLPPEIAKLVDLPSWEDVKALLEDNNLRGFRIDIQTDSTVEPNEAQQKADRVEFVRAIGEYVGNVLPAVQQAPQLLPVVMEGLKFLVRGFRVGREMEDVIDKAADQIMQAAEQAAQNPQPDPKAQTEQIKAQAAQAGAQADQQKAMLQAQHTQQEFAVKTQIMQQEQQFEAAISQQENQIRLAELQAESEKSRTDLQIAQVNASKPQPSRAN